MAEWKEAMDDPGNKFGPCARSGKNRQLRAESRKAQAADEEKITGKENARPTAQNGATQEAGWWNDAAQDFGSGGHLTRPETRRRVLDMRKSREK